VRAAATSPSPGTVRPTPPSAARWPSRPASATAWAATTATPGHAAQPPARWGWDALDLLGVRWFVTNGLPPPEITVMEEHGFRVVQRDAFFLLWERPAPPLARLYHDLDVVPDPADRVARLEAGYPLLERAMVEDPLPDLGRPARPADVRVTERDHARVAVTVRGDADGLLVPADPWYPQWRVEVDGRPAGLLRVDHAFRGVRVPAGSHQVVFRYEDRALRLGMLLSVLAGAGLVGLWGWRRRRGRVRPPGRPAPRREGSP
jgi:Bacterial membrane protein YfhO